MLGKCEKTNVSKISYFHKIYNYHIEFLCHHVNAPSSRGAVMIPEMSIKNVVRFKRTAWCLFYLFGLGGHQSIPFNGHTYKKPFKPKCISWAHNIYILIFGSIYSTIIMHAFWGMMITTFQQKGENQTLFEREVLMTTKKRVWRGKSKYITL